MPARSKPTSAASVLARTARAPGSTASILPAPPDARPSRQPPEQRDLACPCVEPAWCLEDQRHVAQPGIADDPAERGKAEPSLPDRRVAVGVAAEALSRVVQVDRGEAREAEPPLEASQRLVVAAGRRQVVARGQQVAGVETHARALRPLHAGQDLLEMLESMAEARSLPRG